MIIQENQNEYITKEHSTKIFNILKNLTKNLEVSFFKIDHLSPFIYNAFFPNFEIKQIHYNYLICPTRLDLLKIQQEKNNALLFDTDEIQVERLQFNCYLNAYYDIECNEIDVSWNNNFEEFLNNH